MSAYTGLTIPEVLQVGYVQYLIWRRDAYIFALEQTPAGREYLDNAWRMEQTEPDRPALRARFG